MFKIATITFLSACSMLFGRNTIQQPSTAKTKQVSVIGNLSAHNSNKVNADTALLKVGDKCPDFIFRDTTGHTGNDMKLSSLKGKYVLIDVWASWCYPCRMQYPNLLALEEKMKGKNITFVKISIDTHEWRWKGLHKEGIQWMVRDTTFERAFGVNTIPRYILLDKKGVIVDLNLPAPTHPELEEKLNKLKEI
ncbi:TlpA disulfide reductase family protein [Mucilaginibacter sp.]|uniref:TlpA family protein disulfide reductase n=1 Tax=Mucilaginibacter sp. TaxID=1882438 RepID=UPI002ED3A1FA